MSFRMTTNWDFHYVKRFLSIEFPIESIKNSMYVLFKNLCFRFWHETFSNHKMLNKKLFTILLLFGGEGGDKKHSKVFVIFNWTIKFNSSTKKNHHIKKSNESQWKSLKPRLYPQIFIKIELLVFDMHFGKFCLKIDFFVILKLQLQNR